MTPMKVRLLTLLLPLLLPVAALQAAEPITVADFEGDTYGAWKTEGTAFGSGPAKGALDGQQPVAGFEGLGLVNSFLGGDDSEGTLTSPEFKIERKFINFLIGGGGWQGETCMNLLVDGKTVRTATGPNTGPDGGETLVPGSWDVSEFAGKPAVIQIVDHRKGPWGHLLADQIVQADEKAAEAKVAEIKAPEVLVPLEKTLTADGTHLLVPVFNGKGNKLDLPLGIYDGTKLVQSFSVTLPQGDQSCWMAAYPLDAFGLKGKQITIKSTDPSRTRVPESLAGAFDRIKVGSDKDVLSPSDYTQPYRNQFHASTRRGWVNDPNGMVYHDGKYHLYYQHNPFGIKWGNMHWGHLESADLIHWEEKPIALYQKTLADMAYSGNGFVDVDNSAGLGKGTQFAAYTSTARGECIVFSQDGGLTFREIEENPVVKHKGRDPFVFWYEPGKKWVMVLYDETACDETNAVPPDAKFDKQAVQNIAFYESKNLRQWTRTGAFTDPDRGAVYECPGMFELPVAGKPGESRWILLAAQNRYFIGRFDGKTFSKEAGPFGLMHGPFYAAETFGNVPDGRRIQIGWVLTENYVGKFPDQVCNQAFSLPHELTLRETPEGLRLFFWPVKETEKLRGEILAEGRDLTVEQANELLQKCKGELTETLIEFPDDGRKQLVINGMDASFTGRGARIFTDRTFNEVYADDGLRYELKMRSPAGIDATESHLWAPAESTVRSLKIIRLNSIWK